MNPKYPIYIPSKGRWESRLTSKALEKMGVPYYIVIEKQEYNKYIEFINKDKILILPFKNRGLIAARCWIMEHSIKNGNNRHWQLDDNIRWFARIHNNKKTILSTGVCFKVCEDFTDRYKNIALSGLQYEMFTPALDSFRSFIVNTRIYSCTLVNNSIPYRWRSIYNDDTDISLCALKDGWCTILLQAFVCKKTNTMTMKGGNTEDLYKIKDGRLKMAQALQELHPDVTKIVWKWGRWQHRVDYRSFKKNRLIKKKGLRIKKGIDNYGMRLVKIA